MLVAVHPRVKYSGTSDGASPSVSYLEDSTYSHVVLMNGIFEPSGAKKSNAAWMERGLGFQNDVLFTTRSMWIHVILSAVRSALKSMFTL